MNLCPDCDNPFNGYKCKCGFKRKDLPADNRLCAIHSCGKVGVISPHIGKDSAFYCSDHYDWSLNKKRAPKPPSKEMNAECMALLKKRMNNEISGMEYIEALYELDKKYPAAGIRKEADLMLKKFLSNLKAEEDLLSKTDSASLNNE